ncbi:TetR/AcrR family transcriptional regulator [Kribbella sp.]|uniref:TetR/AcrR family transcriptional regulator n=1 Tax=Kribbella sp. TaxID=1871183 RepID=UPI002D369F32|nr:TetR/AcrR family transcriptional regulator [Kribbella sp.]HZX03150.1 TetR/AcrR family transcriptional regulator [Kribbella sp.]
MPRLTEARRVARRTEIVAAARRCFARDGFHRTSMADIAAEAGLSVGAAYRHFAGKEELVLEISGQAFHALFGIDESAAGPTTPAEFATTAAERFAPGAVRDVDGAEVPIDELIRCGIESWAELVRHDGMRARAIAGFDEVRGRIAEDLRRGQEDGLVRQGLDPENAARVLMALLHGYVLQCAAFELTDTGPFVEAMRDLLSP